MRQYPFVYALQNDENLDYDNERSKQLDAKCPDGGRVQIIYPKACAGK